MNTALKRNNPNDFRSAIQNTKIESRVEWQINLNCSALLLHDVQPHYLSALANAERTQMLTNIRRIIEVCQTGGVPVFASSVPVALSQADRGLMREMWGPGPAAAELSVIEPSLGLPATSVRPITKRSYSAFFGSDLEVMLRRTGRSSLLVTGVFTSIGCLASSMDAFMRDIRVFLVSDACADFTPTDHQMGLLLAARTCAKVVSTAEIASGSC